MTATSPALAGAAKPILRVVAAALFDAQGQVLIAERPPGRHMAGWWEFPGGKVAPGETDSAALVRELREELGIDAQLSHELMAARHEYPDRTVQLLFWRVASYAGEPRSLDGQRLKLGGGRCVAQRADPGRRPPIYHGPASGDQRWQLTRVKS
ncbi:MAG: (deoxy)nucleoside triphosphate pyrophosphohydrolase [Steroidobacteraceae bacterium]